MDHQREQVFNGQKVKVEEVLQGLRASLRALCGLPTLAEGTAVTGAEAAAICSICHAAFNGYSVPHEYSRRRVALEVQEFLASHAGLPYSTLYMYAHLKDNPILREHVPKEYWEVFMQASRLRGETLLCESDFDFKRLHQAPAE